MYRVITRKNNLKKLARMAAKLEKAKSEYGYFQEQGTHPSGLSYAYLMSIHEWGTWNGRIPARKPFSIALFQNSAAMLKMTMRGLNKHIMSAARGTYTPIDGALNTFGSMGVYATKSLFGTSALLGNADSTIAKKGFDAPLVEQGDLRDNMAYRTSTNKDLKV